MKIEVKFPELERAVFTMDAKLSSWHIGDSQMSEPERIRQKLYEGIEIEPAEVNTSYDGLLSYAGEQVLLYIKDSRQHKDTLLYDRKNSRRFHFYNCTTLKNMQSQGRYDRYVVTRRDDGAFPVYSYDRETREFDELEAPLAPCKYCLKELDYKCYNNISPAEQTEIWNSFLIKDFFAEYLTFFVHKPRYTDGNAPPPGYTRGWSKISKRYRDNNGWACELCGVNLEQHRSYLHVHHKNGVPADNSASNLQALCYLCHSEQPLHTHMKPTATIRSKIQQLRMRQGASRGF